MKYKSLIILLAFVIFAFVIGVKAQPIQPTQSLQLKTFKINKTLADCGYGPSAANCIKSNPKTCIGLRESGVLAAYQAPQADGILHVWYQDEHALSLGSGTVSPMNQNPGHVVNPNTGNPNGVDPQGRPLRPGLFITDITDNSKDKSGDWEWGGKLHEVHEIFGSWKSLNARNPKPNGRNLGPGSLNPPANVIDRYTSEVRWDMNKLSLKKGRTYRLEFMVHDGDFGGDSGEKCAIINY